MVLAHQPKDRVLCGLPVDCPVLQELHLHRPEVFLFKLFLHVRLELIRVLAPPLEGLLGDLVVVVAGVDGAVLLVCRDHLAELIVDFRKLLGQ